MFMSKLPANYRQITGKLQASYEPVTSELLGEFQGAHLAPGKVTNNLGYKSVGKLGY